MIIAVVIGGNYFFLSSFSEMFQLHFNIGIEHSINTVMIFKVQISTLNIKKKHLLIAVTRKCFRLP